MTPQPQLVVISNQSTVVTDADVTTIAAALNLQLSRDFNRSGWVKRGLAPAGTVGLLDKGSKPPAGAWVLNVLDHSDQAGALGYHDDVAGTKIPFADVFAVDTQQDGEQVSAVCSHELLEMLVDPFVDPMRPRMVRKGSSTDYYIVEACDAQQGGDYDVGDGHGTRVADFALPSWWELTGYRPTSQKGTTTEPWEVAPGGYMSIFDAKTGQWRQVFGETRQTAPAWSSRLPRVHPRAPHSEAIAAADELALRLAG